jgi:hypothetical protein
MPPDVFLHDILGVTLQDGPIDLLCPNFNLMAAKTDSTIIKAKINMKVICLATPSVIDHLFNWLCPGYSKEPHAALNHIRQMYNDSNSNTVFSSVFEYYTQILATSCLFINQEVLPIRVCQAFMDGLDSCLLAGFRTYFPDYRKLQERTATHQRKVLQAILQAALCAEMEFNNIRTIASGVYGGGGQAIPAQVNASQLEKTMTCYGSGDKGTNKSNSTLGRLPLHCYGCGGLHPWLALENGIYVIKCPQAGDTHIAKNARRTINRIQAKRKKQQQESKKHKNLTTANYADFDDEGKERIKQQVLQSVKVATYATGMCSSITGITGATSTASAGAGAGHGHGRGKPIVFLYDAQVLQTETHRPVLPVAIQSVMPHITLQLGTGLDCSNCPSIRCVVNTAAALCTGNYHFFSAIAKWYPHCVAKIFLPKHYSPIILLGIVQDDSRAITTDLAMAFQFQLPYTTKDEHQTSFIVATRPQVSVNMVLGLLLITATGMIIDTVNNVMEAKHLDCPPFRINFCCTTKTIPAIEEDATTHYVELKDVQNVLAKTDAYIAGVCECYQLVKPPKIRISKPHWQVGAVRNSKSVSTT